MDNGSHEETKKELEQLAAAHGITYLYAPVEFNFSRMCNMGAEKAAGEYLLFLNNDTEVTNGWLDELLLALKTADHPGAVGAKLIYPHIPEGTVNEGKSWLIQHAGIAFRPIMWQKVFYFEPYNMENGMPDDHPEDRLIERAGVTAAALLIRKSVFEEIGCFDENYLYGYEDVDLCLKLHQAGYKNYYCPS